ncbi:hypothetical protein Cgig2_018592 [Carnegiea gigantea]|uniref:DUF4283 domain-containing protein n=1 Tax=Carnegiea gigantea TaxID=171969 RepID=A0A9Q1K433_9CARY|nr:hypothetical protein Cgig2_018592 [Carnegiea gigantea]
MLFRSNKIKENWQNLENTSHIWVRPQTKWVWKEEANDRSTYNSLNESRTQFAEKGVEIGEGSSQHKFILTFRNEEEMEEVLRNHRGLDQWLFSVRKWNTYEVCETRRIRIEVFRLPRHIWNRSNFKAIANLLGNLDSIFIKENDSGVKIIHSDGPIKHWDVNSSSREGSMANNIDDKEDDDLGRHMVDFDDVAYINDDVQVVEEMPN